MAVSEQNKNVTVGPAEVSADALRSGTADGFGDFDADGAMDELRQTLSELRSVIESRSQRAVGVVRETVQEYPFASVAGAAVIGAIVGLALTPSRHRRRFKVGGFDVLHPLEGVSMPSLPNRASLEPLTSRFERFADQLSKLDTGTTSSFLKTARQWVDAAVDQLGSYRNR